MSNIAITPGTGVSSVATETIAGIDFQRIKVVDATGGSTTGLKVNADGTITASVYGNITVSGSVSASIIGTVPVVQSGTVITSVSGTLLTANAPVASFVSAVTSLITSTSQTSVLLTAPGAQRNYVTQILVTNAAAVGTFVDIMDGPSIIYSGYAAASGGGFSASFPTPLRQGNTVQSLDTKARTQASIIVAISGFTAA